MWEKKERKRLLFWKQKYSYRTSQEAVHKCMRGDSLGASYLFLAHQADNFTKRMSV